MKILLALAAAATLPGLGFTQDTTLVSSGPAGQADGPNTHARMSADGRFVVWQTLAANLVPGDTDATRDIVLKDLSTGALELISRTPAGTASTAHCYEPSISASGRFVAFRTNGAGTLPGDAAGVFLYDRQTGVMRSASGSGSVNAVRPHVSPDGRYVVYATSHALDPLDTNTDEDIYRYDRVTAAIERVSIDAGGVQSTNDVVYPTVSSGGRFVAFSGTSSTWGAAFAGQQHMWVKDMQTGELTAVSTLPDGTPSNGPCGRGAISTDGRYVTFQAVSSNLFPASGSQQIAWKDRLTGAIEVVSQNDGGAQGNNYSYDPLISPDGRFVLFRSAASNLHLGGTNAYYGLWVRDVRLGVTRKVSLSSAATGHASGTDNSWPGGVSASGRFVVFTSNAANLTADDTNGTAEDVFVRDRFGDATFRYGWSLPMTIGCLPHIEGVGTPSASAGSGFLVQLQDTRGGQAGLLVYSTSGAAATPLLGGFLYVGLPFVRTSLVLSGGSSNSCSGLFSFDFNTWAATGPDAALVAGTRVWAQYWSRDPGDPDNAYLSDALSFVLAP